MSFFDTYGYCPFFSNQIIGGTTTSGLQPGRVINVQRQQCRLATARGDKSAQVSGRFSFTALGPDDYPQVGDWVLFRGGEDDGPVIVERVFDRKTTLARKGVASNASQVIATNVDTVMIVQSCNHDVNLRRIERYLAACGEHQLQAVLVFNKSDLLGPDGGLPFVLPESWQYPVHLVSANTGSDLSALSPYLQPGKTCVLMGSSGVGKSTLINRLCHGTLVRQVTQDIRETDSKGRHTTTARELFFTDTGGMIIDTPGMREFGLAEADVEASGAFSDIQAYGEHCQFRDCQHGNEPGCAVRTAIEEGRLDVGRLTSLQKLRREEEYFQRRVDPVAAANSKRKWKTIHKAMRNHPKKGR